MKATTYENGTESAAGTYEARGGFSCLLRQDAARRSLRWSLPIALFIGLVLRAVAGTDLYDWDRLPVYKHHNDLVYLLIQLWLALVFAIIIAHFNSRCSSLSLGLPIRPRRLWLARIVALTGAGVLPVAVVVLSISLFSGGALFDPALGRIGARVAAGIVLSVVLFQVPDRGIYRIQGTPAYRWYVAAVTVALLAYVIATPGHWLYTLLPLAAAAVIAAVICNEMPPGFQTSILEARKPQEAYGARVGRDAHWSVSSPAARRLRIVLLVLRETVNSWSGWLMVLLITVSVWGLLAQYYAAYHSLHDFLILMLWIWIMMDRTTKRLTRFDSLPVSRRLVFWVMIAVVAVSMGVGLTIGYTLHHVSDSPVSQVRTVKGQVRVPFDAWEFTRNGTVPEVVSPWGESHRPGGMCLFGKGSAICVYNPYEIGGNSSSEFIAWQIDRAVDRVHGPDAGSTGRSDSGPDSLYARIIKKEKFTIPSSLYRRSSLRMQTNALIVTLWAILFAVLAAVWWRRFRPGADYAASRWFVILFFSLPYVFLFGLLALDARGLVDADAALALTMIGLRSITETIPLGLGGWTAAAALTCGAGLWYVQRCFVRAEATPHGGTKNLLSEY
jgi:hypothetical protein